MSHVTIKRIDPTLPLPQYETSGAVGFDLLVREDTEVPPHGLALAPNNIIVETPPGYMLMLASRSSTPRKKGLMLGNGIGVVDLDYCGPDDEVKSLLHNFTDHSVIVKRGEKVSQALFVRVDRFDFDEASDIQNKKTRGGFGSTGGHL